MRKEEVEAFYRRRPFEPFEIRLVDGQRFRFTSPEQLILARTTIMTMDKKGDPLLIGLQMISTVRSANGHASRKT